MGGNLALRESIPKISKHNVLSGALNVVIIFLSEQRNEKKIINNNQMQKNLTCTPRYSHYSSPAPINSANIATKLYDQEKWNKYVKNM